MAVSNNSFAKDTSQDDTDETTSREDGAPTIIVCNDLKEKIDTVVPLQEKVSSDFATVSDSGLCDALSQQCEYFYKITKYYEKEYRNQCNKGYELTISVCDYSANGCQKAEESGSPAKYSKYRAGA